MVERVVAEAEEAPDVSVIVPTRDRKLMLERAVSSCEKAAEGEISLEVIVIDDGSIDGTREHLRETAPRAVYFRFDRSRGRGCARNAGLEAAGGEFVKFLDDDDWLEQGALADEVRLARETEADIVAGGHFSAAEDNTTRYLPPPPLVDGIDSILRGEAVPTAAALYRRSAIGDLRWDEKATKLDDWHFFVRVALRPSRLARLDRPVYTWWSHAGQGVRVTSRLDNAREFYWVLDEMESTLAELDELTPARRRRLAQYRYKELRTLCRFDRDAFERETTRIRSLDPSFRPLDEESQLLMRSLARAVDFRRAVVLHERIRLLVSWLRRGQSA